MKTIKILLVFVLVAFSYQQADAYICHVPQDSSTIQGCIDAVSDGDTVLVERGTYYENIDFLGRNILVASNYIFDRLQATVDSTIIDGGGLGRVVKMQSVIGTNAGIIGFTITNGRADNGGGGIYCYLTSARISHNVITGDTAGSGYGGGIYVGGKSSPTIDSNQILDNSATVGGGVMYNDSSFGEIYGNIIRKNRAWPDNGGGNGGGLHISGGSYPNIHNNIIDSNTVRYYGGGISCSGGSSPNITENDIAANDAPAGGGGISCASSSPTIERNTIRENDGECGGGIYVAGCSLTIRSNQILNNVGGGIGFWESSLGDVFDNLIRNNHAQNGGGIQIYGGSSPDIHNNTIDSNTVVYYGGGIDCGSASSPNITENDIVANDGPAGGGGISCGSSSPMIERNTIRKNVSRDCGGGILLKSCHATVERNVLGGNHADSQGGAIEFYEDSSTANNNTVVGNSAGESQAGGGFRFYSSSICTVRNNIIVGSTDGYGISCSPTSHPHISYNDIWDNYDGNFYGCPPGVGDTSWGENRNDTPCDSFYNIIQDPLFDPDSTNYFLLWSSPCIDAGDSSDPVPPCGGRYIDMGAVEYPYLCGDCNGDCVINSADVVYLINYLFKGGPPPVPDTCIGDVNCDDVVNSADVVYLINYLFKGGPPPCPGCCGGEEPSLASLPSRLYPLSDFAEITVSEPSLAKDGISQIVITGKFGLELAAVELEVNYDPEQIKLIEPALTPRCEGLQIYFGADDGQLKVGILDINGVHLIPAGEGPILTLKVQGKNLSSLKLSEAIVVDQEAHAFLANVVEKLETTPALPGKHCLHQNYPNPFNPETQISYDLPNDSWVKLSVYNISGQKVKTLVDRFEAAGHKTVTWDGRNQEGDRVGSGVYFYRLEAGEFTATKKMVLIR